MRALFVSLLACSACMAADFYSGQAARGLIGQANFTADLPGATSVQIGGINGIAYGANTLFVADSNHFGALGSSDSVGNPVPNNNRVLAFQNLNLTVPPLTARFDLTGSPCNICVGAANYVIGQPDFTQVVVNNPAGIPTAKNLRTPTGVATDGTILAVADTDNNRVLIWRTLPTSMDQAADVVVGQANFTGNVPSNGGNNPLSAKTLSGPEGVWIQNGRLFVADSFDHRVLIYNSIPTTNGVAADVVLGQPDFVTTLQKNLVNQTSTATASLMSSPVSVSSDGTHLFVVDLGHNRVLIWNKIPTTNFAPADVEIGQPDMVSGNPNNSYTVPATQTLDADNNPEGLTAVLCQSTSTDAAGTALFPSLCAKTISFPRAVIFGGGRLFIADGGNDRVLVYNSIPTANGAAADIVLGEPDFITDNATAAADSMTTPSGLAWDGANLYVSDSFNARILIFTPGDHFISTSGVRNAASKEIFALGSVNIGGTLTAKDTVTVSIGKDSNATPVAYTYTVTADDATLYTTNPTAAIENIVQALIKLINGQPSGTPDPNVTAGADITTLTIVLTAKTGGAPGANVTVATSVSTSATITASASGANLNLNYQDAAQIAPGTLVLLTSADGTTFSDVTASFNFTSSTFAPPIFSDNTGADTQVYIDGFAVPLISVSPTQIVAQLPWELGDRTSASAWIRVQHADGTVTVTTPVAVSIVTQNPGIFTDDTQGVTTDPKPGLVFHASTNATGAVSVDGIVAAGDITTITITSADGTIANTYNYTVLATDTLDSIRDGLIGLINKAPDPLVTAKAANQYDRIILTAIGPGPIGNNVQYSGSANSTASVIVTALGSATCCANTAGARVTPGNPAVPGENLYIYATGLGADNPRTASTGQVTPTDGSLGAPPLNPVDSILAGGSTANGFTSLLAPGMVGVWQVLFQLNSSLPDDPLTQLTIAQQAAVSNVVTFAVATPGASTGGLTTDARRKVRQPKKVAPPKQH